MTNASPDQDQAAPQSWPSPNPALTDLSVLAGEWEMELYNAAFLPSPSERVKAYALFAWVEDGAFLEMRQGARPLKAPNAVWLMGRDESAAEYRILYYDSRGVSRVYSMSFEDGTWKIWRNSPRFSQRYEARVSPDGNAIHAHWEKSSDGRNWEHDFDMDYKRVR